MNTGHRTDRELASAVNTPEETRNEGLLGMRTLQSGTF